MRYGTPILIILVAAAVAICFLPPSLPSYGTVASPGLLTRVFLALFGPVVALFGQANCLLDRMF